MGGGIGGIASGVGGGFGGTMFSAGKGSSGKESGWNPMYQGKSLGGLFSGSGPLAEAFGLEKKQGEYFQPETGNAGLDQLNLENSALVDPKYMQKMSDVSSGKANMHDTLSGLSGPQLEGAQTNGVIGSRLASQEVANDPMQKGLYGEGGLQSQLGQQGKDLASRGYSLQQPDYEAYGQASGDIARQFGQQEADTSAALSRRGLGSASSGASGAAFSGLQGNKNEMLAKAQTDIAQKRMQDTQQRLLANQQMQSQLGQQGAAAQQSQYARQLAGAQNRQQNVTNAANIQNTSNNNANQANLASMQDKRGSMGKSLLEGVGQGMFSSGQQIGASPGTGASSFSSSMGSSLGSGSMMASDERNKENIQDGSGEIEGFLDSLGTHKYDYTPDAKGLAGAGDGEHYSPMAQELEQTPVGASMVQDTPDGKQVDYGKGFGALASGLGELNSRLKRLEGRA